ncbi:MAG: hypothetical protein AAB903_01105 [Patescibacteria group bacterium]
MHFHLLAPLSKPGVPMEARKAAPNAFLCSLRTDHMVFEAEGIRAYAAGLRAGQCVITATSDDGLATAANQLVTLCNEKWLEKNTGKRPDYSMLFQLWPEEPGGMAIYTPILNILGGSEVIAALLPGQYCSVLAVPHGEVAEYLRS